MSPYQRKSIRRNLSEKRQPGAAAARKSAEETTNAVRRTEMVPVSEDPAAVLSDRRFLAAQRQSLAAQVNQLHGNQVLQRLVASNAAGNAKLSPFPHSKTTWRQVQRFGAKEHQDMGNLATGSKGYLWNDPTANGAGTGGGVPFRLTHGDIIMLSGDLFDPRDTIVVDGVEKPNPDSLFRLAGTPSSSPGQVPGTQDEVIYALKKSRGDDPRFATGGVWGNIQFSKAVIDAVDNRYLRLAAVNKEHFGAPQGKDVGPGAGLGASAGGSYRALHEDAILRAFFAAVSGKDNGEGLTREAAAQHFLTDHFAAGHLRTPRASIQEHWRGKYPLFFENFKKKVAHDLAVYINANETKGATVLGTVQDIAADAYGTVVEKTKGLPALGFEDLVSMVAHDLDNEMGLWVENDIGDHWQTFGDSNLSKSADTINIMTKAIRWGNEDIQRAHALGKTNPGPMATEWILNTVRSQLPSGAAVNGKYAPEQLIPRLDPAKETSVQTWKADSIDELWDKQVRSDSPRKYGDELTKSVQNGEIKDQLSGLASMVDAEKKTYKYGVYLGTVHPQAAYKNGFLAPLLSNPKQGLKDIIDFNPALGQANHNEDDAVIEEMDAMNEKQLSGMTLNQRVDRVRVLISGYGSEEDGENVIKLFKTAQPGERPKLYSLVEGHPWKGDWVQGVFVSDDEIWNALYRSQLNRLRDIINAK